MRNFWRTKPSVCKVWRISPAPSHSLMANRVWNYWSNWCGLHFLKRKSLQTRTNRNAQITAISMTSSSRPRLWMRKWRHGVNNATTKEKGSNASLIDLHCAVLTGRDCAQSSNSHIIHVATGGTAGRNTCMVNSNWTRIQMLTSPHACKRAWELELSNISV